VKYLLIVLAFMPNIVNAESCLNNDNETVKKVVLCLVDQLENLQTQVENLPPADQDIQTVLEQFQSLTNDLTELQAKMDDLKSMVESQSTRLSALEKPADALKQKDLATMLVQTQAQLLTINQKLTDLQAADTSLYKQVQQQQVSQQEQLAGLTEQVQQQQVSQQEQLARLEKQMLQQQASEQEQQARLAEQAQQQVFQQEQLARLEKTVFKTTPKGMEPEILQFCVSKGESCQKNVTLCYGEPITIQWKTQYGDAALLTTQRGKFVEKTPVLLEDKQYFSSITEPMRLTLAVQNQLSDDNIRTVSETIEINFKQPEITLAATDDNIYGCSGEPVELHWAVGCAKEALLNGDPLEALTGTKQFALLEPKTFTVIATNGQQSIERQLSFDLQKPVINYLNLSQEAGCYGETSTIEWKTSCADQVTLLRNGEELEKLVPNQPGKVSWPIKQTDQLTLKAQSGPYQQTQALEITLQPPEIEFFELTQETACYGDNITANWKARCASDMALIYDDGVNEPITLPVDLEGDYDFNLTTKAADLTLTATNSQDKVSAPQHIALAAPVIDYLRTDKRTGCYGDEITATWSASCLKDVQLSIGEQRSAVDARGQSTFSLDNTNKRVMLTATNGFESDKKQLRLTLQEPIIDHFSVDNEQLCRGDTATVSWQVSCANLVSLQSGEQTQWLNALQGTTPVQIDQDTELTLKATNGETETEQAASISTLMPSILDFSVDRKQVCYGESILAQWQTQCADQVLLKQPDGTHQPVEAEQTDFAITILEPQKLTLLAQKGYYLDQKEIDVTLAPAQIDFFEATADSGLGNLCYGESVDLAWQASCAKEVMLAGQKVAERGTDSIRPDKPQELLLEANNGIERVTKRYTIDFQAPQISQFCGPTDVIFLGDRYRFHWEGDCNASYRLKPIDGPEQYTGTDNEATITLSSAEYQLIADNHAGENPEQLTLDLALKLTPKELISIKSDGLKPFFMTQYEITEAEYQQCDTCNQYQPQHYEGLYCITEIDLANRVIVGQKGYSESAIACLSLSEAEYLLDGIEGFHYNPTPSSLGISDKKPANSCTLNLGGSFATGLPVWSKKDHSINCVSWQDAIQFANWRSQQQELSPCYDEQYQLVDEDCVGYRLPTSDEWQLAALGDPNDNRWFPWGQEPLDCDEKGQADCTFPKALPKGTVSKDRSPFGVQDLGLNLTEWTQDTKSYEGDDIVYAITRGYSWATKWPRTRHTSRFNMTTESDRNEYLLTDRTNTVGFRLVRWSPDGLPVMESTNRCVSSNGPNLVEKPISPQPPNTEKKQPVFEVESDPFEGWEYDE
jgi:formylglycine-generating enzyme required for sulfatase activity/uncharacterized ubiquitin-like protein YukD